jgi:hypothetical protein
MIRRGFWLTAGAVTGIYGYRRISAVGRRLSGKLTWAGQASPGDPASLADRGNRGNRGRSARLGALRLAREAFRFSTDVREGMDLYMAKHSAPAGSTLMTDHDRDAQPKDGR